MRRAKASRDLPPSTDSDFDPTVITPPEIEVRSRQDNRVPDDSDTTYSVRTNTLIPDPTVIKFIKVLLGRQSDFAQIAVQVRSD